MQGKKRGEGGGFNCIQKERERERKVYPEQLTAASMRIDLSSSREAGHK